MGDTQPPPTLDYQSKRNPWMLADLRHGWPALLLLAVVLLMQGYSTWRLRADEKRQAALRLAEQQYNARVAPLLQADPRFRWVSKVGEAGYTTNSITPSGVVDSAANREALRAILQGASPPMPLNMQFVTVSPTVGAATRAAADIGAEVIRLQQKWDADRKREADMEAAERAYNARVAPLLKREPRFRGVLVHDTTGWLMNRVQPFGFVETEADREDLRKLLQDANPPMPLSFEYVFVTPERFSATRPARPAIRPGRRIASE